MFHSQARQTATGENPVKSSSAPAQGTVVRASAAAAAYPIENLGDMDEAFTLVHRRNLADLLPPSKEALLALTALPAAMFQTMQRRSGGKGSKNRGGRLVRDGEIVSRLFDNAAGRPQPRNGISLEQSITLEVSVAIQNVITSSATAGIPSYASSIISTNQFASALTPLLSVFDQYRFDQVEAWLECQAPNGTAAIPELISSVDLDDGNTPTTVGRVQDKQGSITSGGLAGHYHKFKPHVAVAVYSGAFTSFGNAPAGWIDSASPSVEHYGLKFATISTGGSFSYTLVLRAVMSFRSPSIN